MAKVLPPASNDGSENGDVDDGIAAPPAEVAVVGEGDASEGGKIKMIVQLVKRCLGVKDIAAMCVSRSEAPIWVLTGLTMTFQLNQAIIAASIVVRAITKLGVLALLG